MGRARFSIVEMKRAAKALKDAGWPVDKMACRVDDHGFTLLPTSAASAPDAEDLDIELAEWRRTHANG